MKNNVKRGKYGEDLACKYLQEQGIIILEKNYRCRFGEIDIIARDNEYIVFIEVKYRRSFKFGYPREAVGVSKQLKIKNTCMNYLNCKNFNCVDLRFDVVEILHYKNQIKIEHIKNAF